MNDAYTAIVGTVINAAYPTPQAFAVSGKLMNVWDWQSQEPRVEPEINAAPSGDQGP